MPKPRNKQIALSETPFYHLTYRCVRRSFLCGEIDGCNFEHRREWIVERLKLLTNMFAIDVASYAIMMNHYHILVRVDVAKAATWSVAEIFERWINSGQPLFGLILTFLQPQLKDMENLSG